MFNNLSYKSYITIYQVYFYLDKSLTLSAHMHANKRHRYIRMLNKIIYFTLLQAQEFNRL